MLTLSVTHGFHLYLTTQGVCYYSYFGTSTYRPCDDDDGGRVGGGKHVTYLQTGTLVPPTVRDH